MSGSFHLKKFEFGRSFISSLWITATYPHFLDRGARRPFVSAYQATVVCTIPPATKSFASRRKLKPSAARSADCRTPKFVFASGLFNPCRFVVPIFPSTWARSRVMRSFTRGPTSHFAWPFGAIPRFFTPSLRICFLCSLLQPARSKPKSLGRSEERRVG